MKKFLFFCATMLCPMVFPLVHAQINVTDPGSTYVLADTTFCFSKKLNVEGKIYYKEYATRYKDTQKGQEHFFPVKDIALACDTFALQLCRMIHPDDSSGLSAITISSGTQWFAMYGETHIFGDSTEIKEVGGSGKKDGYFYVYFCPPEQAIFSLRVKVKDERLFIDEIRRMYILVEQVGAGKYLKN